MTEKKEVKTTVKKEIKKVKSPSVENTAVVKKSEKIVSEKNSDGASIKVKKSKKSTSPKTSGNAIITRGGRKSSVASIMLWSEEKNSGAGFILVNDKDLSLYFDNVQKLLTKIAKVFKISGEQASKYKIKVNVYGGGKNGQACAIANGIAKALVLVDASVKGALKKEGLLTRDSRSVQSKNTGQPKARKVEQFSKR